MAIYTTFFACDPQELLDAFPGWRAPLDQPVRREIRNPFTGETMVIESREPEWSEYAESQKTEYQIIRGNGSYGAYLKERLPLSVRRLPHWATKGLTQVELYPLLEILEIEQKIEMAIYSPPTSDACIEVFPKPFLTRLASIDLERTSLEWAEATSTPEHTHSISGVKLSEGWTASEALEILKAVRTLACKAKPSEMLYLLTEA